MNELQELEAIRDANGILAIKQAETVQVDAIWTKLYHAKQYLNGIASRILNAADEF